MTLIFSRFGKQWLTIWNIHRIVYNWRENSLVFSVYIFQRIYICKNFASFCVTFNCPAVSRQILRNSRVKKFSMRKRMRFSMNISSNFKLNLHIINVNWSLFMSLDFFNFRHRNLRFEKIWIWLFFIFEQIFHVIIHFLFSTHVFFFGTNQVS